MNPLTRRQAMKTALLGVGLWEGSGTRMAAALEITTNTEKTMKFDHDVLIVGGGPAGLSAAMSLGRLARTALVCDDSRPRNEPSSHLNNFPTRDGIHPAAWRKAARQDLEKYETIQFFSGTVRSVTKHEDGGFLAVLSSADPLRFRKVILADGIEDRLPEAPGFRELWGKSVFHCAYCHGYEVRNQAIGAVVNGEMAAHLVALLGGLSEDLILFTDGSATLNPELKEALKRRGVPVVEARIKALQQEGGILKGVLLEDGQMIAREGLFVAPRLPFVMKSPLGGSLGCGKTETGLYKVSELNETTVKGVFAAGDNMARQQSVLHACAHGFTAGAGAVFQLLNEKFLS